MPLREQVRAKFDAYFERKGNQPSMKARRDQVDAIFREMDETDFDEETRVSRVESLMQFVNDLDATRRLSFARAVPEIYEGLTKHRGEWDTRTRHAPDEDPVRR